MKTPKVLVLRAPGINCERETLHAFARAGGAPSFVHIRQLLAAPDRLDAFTILAVPGGFSYGDDISSGRVLAQEMKQALGERILRFVGHGGLVLGICNGFQVLVRTGLLPFGELGRQSATLVQNESGRYECRWVTVAPEGDSAFVEGLPPIVRLPVANGEGRFRAEPAVMDRIEAAGLVALRYVDAAGAPTAAYPANPNGSQNAIAGLCDPTGRILGLMPHPERYLAPFQAPDWHARGDAGGVPHGLRLLQRVVAAA